MFLNSSRSCDFCTWVTSTTDWRTLEITAYNWQCVLKLHYVLPEDGTPLLKHVRNMPLIFMCN